MLNQPISELDPRIAGAVYDSLKERGIQYVEVSHPAGTVTFEQKRASLDRQQRNIIDQVEALPDELNQIMPRFRSHPHEDGIQWCIAKGTPVTFYTATQRQQVLVVTFHEVDESVSDKSLRAIARSSRIGFPPASKETKPGEALKVNSGWNSSVDLTGRGMGEGVVGPFMLSYPEDGLLVWAQVLATGEVKECVAYKEWRGRVQAADFALSTEKSILVNHPFESSRLMDAVSQKLGYGSRLILNPTVILQGYSGMIPPQEKAGTAQGRAPRLKGPNAL